MFLELATAPESLVVKPIKIEEYLGLAKAAAIQFLSKYEKVEDTDVYAVACESLVIASQSYNPSVGPFRQFAYRAMRNGIIGYLKRQKTKKRSAVEQVLSFKDWEQVPETVCEVPLSIDLLPKLLASSSEDSDQDKFDKSLLVEVYLQGVPVVDIAKREKITRVTIYNRINRIMRKIRERYQDESNA